MSFTKRLILVLGVVGISFLAGCNLLGPEDENGSTAASLGESFTLPGGEISGWGSDFDGSAEVAAFSLAGDEYDSVAVGGDGSFSGLSISADSLSDFALEGSDIEGVFFPGVTVDQPDTGLDVIQFQVVGDRTGHLSRASGDNNVQVEWWYAEGPVNISGRVDDTDLRMDMALTTGWNTVVYQRAEAGTETTATVSPEPNGVQWNY